MRRPTSAFFTACVLKTDWRDLAQAPTAWLAGFVVAADAPCLATLVGKPGR
jgi:hypothetical protein